MFVYGCDLSSVLLEDWMFVCELGQLTLQANQPLELARVCIVNVTKRG